MRKNKIEGAIKGAGRKKTGKALGCFLNVRITSEARAMLYNVDAMNRGRYVSRLIVEDQQRELDKLV